MSTLTFDHPSTVLDVERRKAALSHAVQWSAPTAGAHDVVAVAKKFYEFLAGE